MRRKKLFRLGEAHTESSEKNDHGERHLCNLNAEGKLEPRYVFHSFEGDGSTEADSHVLILPEGKYVTLD
ncbi:hypothetical protein J14TS5_43290 [Paenibacillus lautus]|nr:hypothetical protein J14TS5_43290 [Paenibacillus lautus]